jgi:hypothetical protein
VESRRAEVRVRPASGMVRSPILFAPASRLLLMDALQTPRFIPSQLQRGHRFAGSDCISPVGGLWMNLWKLCIAAELLQRLGCAAEASVPAWFVWFA